MEIWNYVGALLYISLMRGPTSLVTANFDPTTHKNWHLVNSEHCGLRPVVGGDSDESSYNRLGGVPWVVRIVIANPAIEVNNDNVVLYTCSGTIITHKHVLTASSCFYPFEDINIIPAWICDEDLYWANEKGGDGCKRDYLQYDIEKVTFYHTNDEARFGKNIALVTIKKNIVFDGYVAPICLEHGNELETGFGIRVIGWGRNPEGGVVYTSRASKFTDHDCLDIFDHLPKSFQSEESPYSQNAQTFFCVRGSRDQRHTDGEVGTPYMVEYGGDGEQKRVYLHGFLSFKVTEMDNDEYGPPGIYTKVSFYMEWILDKIGNDINSNSVN